MPDNGGPSSGGPPQVIDRIRSIELSGWGLVAVAAGVLIGILVAAAILAVVLLVM